MSRYYRIPIAAQAVYEQLRVWIDVAIGLPGPRGTTWFPPTADATKDEDYIYVHLREEHYQLPLIQPWVDQTIATTWMEQITEQQWYEALDAMPDPGDDPPPPTGPQPWVQPAGAHDAYGLGARVTHNDQTWESTVDPNTWEPGVYGWVVV